MNSPWLLWLLLLQRAIVALSENNNRSLSVDKINNENIDYETWVNAEKLIRQFMDIVTKKALPLIVKINSEVTLSSDCMGSLMKLFMDLRQFKGWAVKMIDAMGKPTAGLLEGVVASLGSYDECLDIEVERPRKTPIRGQYCLLEMWPPLPPKPTPAFIRKFVSNIKWDLLPSDKLFDMARNYSFLFHLAKIQYGVCVPSTCSYKEVEDIAKAVLQEMKFNGSLHRCEVKRGLKFTSDQIIIACALVIVFLFVTIGSLLDIYACRMKMSHQICMKINDNNGKFVRILLAFSILRNTSKLLKPDATYPELSSLHGFRFLTVTGIMMAATYGYFDPIFYQKIGYLYDTTRTVTFQIILGGQVAINSLFFLSGILTMYFTIKSLKGERQLSIRIFLFHRLCRLIPTILLILGLMMMVPLISSGPVWQEMVGHYIDVCRTNWWTNILFISNWWPFSQMCLMSMWFLSSDMQLHLLSLLIIFPFFKSPKLALFIGIFLEICRAIAVAIVTLVYKVEPPLMSPDRDVWANMIDKIYLKPHSLNGAFSVGLLAGYLIAEHSSVIIRLKYQVLGWCFTIGCSLAMLCLPHHLGKTPEPNVAGTVLYMTFHQTAWALAMAWIAVMCALGYGGPIQKTLSFKLIIPLSRLSFTAFLLHEVVIRTRYSTIRQTLIFSHYNMFYEFCSHFLISFALAYACYVVVEAPFSKVERILFPHWDYACQKSTKDTCFSTEKEVEKVNKKEIQL
ncbi:nose resistant to fluoxetine protein 6-like [Centruroides sculpturatus]|uniref:nose resistant to fluoxetine protein 6-like n=1 Tax=Centruroides sculpturatus TaxID=218467 RepID=UPI000C6DA15E|nr:nose resistant to fluoxetine protein 6-like [Centruroides sculpturatus]